VIRNILFAIVLTNVLFAFYNADMLKIIASLVNSPIGSMFVSFIAVLILFFNKNHIRIMIYLGITFLFFLFIYLYLLEF